MGTGQHSTPCAALGWAPVVSSSRQQQPMHANLTWLPARGVTACRLQMLPAVTPEQYPPEPPPGSAAAEHDGRLQALHAQQQREQMLREQHHTDRWGCELLDQRS